MRISELAGTTEVPVHTLKYYLREGLLMPGVPVSRTRADYTQGHVERVRLVRALVEHGGVGIAGVRAILDALAAPPPSRHDLLGVAHCALPTPSAQHPVGEEVAALVDGLSWRVGPDSPAMHSLTAAIDAARAAGVDLPTDLVRRYAEAMAEVAVVDVSVALRSRTAEEAMRTVVIGTVMIDPVLLALRRVAQEALSAERSDEET